MKSLFWILALFVLAVSISLAFNINEGYVLVVLPPYRADFSLNLAIIVLLFGLVLLYVLARGASLTLSLPQRIRSFRARRMAEKSHNAFGEGVRLLFEGRYSEAMKKAAEAHKRAATGYPKALSALLAARIAQSQGDFEQQQKWLEQSVHEDPRTQPASWMLTAETNTKAGHFGEAIELLKCLQESSGTHPTALCLELQACQGVGQWDDVLRIARLLEKKNALAADKAQDIKDQAHAENIAQRNSTLDELQAYLKTIPSSERTSALDSCIVKAMLHLEANEEASKFIGKRLTKGWNPQLVELYGQIRGGDMAKRIAQADSWLQQHPDDLQLLLALGRMNIEQYLWDKAKAHLKAALSVATTAEEQRQIHLELARLCEETERDEDTIVHYRAVVATDDGKPCLEMTPTAEIPALIDKD